MNNPKRLIHFILFAFLMVATYFSWNWAWGLLFFYWTIDSLRNRKAFFLDPVFRDEEPIFYWIIIVAWFALAILMIVMSIPALYPFFYPEYFS